MQYANYLLNNIPQLLDTECREDESAGFLGVRFFWAGEEFTASVDGYKVNVRLAGTKWSIRHISKNIFTVGKKEDTNFKHADAIKNYLTRLLVAAGKVKLFDGKLL